MGQRRVKLRQYDFQLYNQLVDSFAESSDELLFLSPTEEVMAGPWINVSPKKRNIKSAVGKTDVVNIDQYENFIIQKKVKLLADKSNYLNQLKANESHPDIADEGSDREMEYKLEAIIESIDIRIYQLEKALGRLKNGTYGLCEECREEISSKRLNAIPEAFLCVSCADISYEPECH